MIGAAEKGHCEVSQIALVGIENTVSHLQRYVQQVFPKVRSNCEVNHVDRGLLLEIILPRKCRCSAYAINPDATCMEQLLHVSARCLSATHSTQISSRFASVVCPTSCLQSGLAYKAQAGTCHTTAACRCIYMQLLHEQPLCTVQDSKAQILPAPTKFGNPNHGRSGHACVWYSFMHLLGAYFSRRVTFSARCS